jgi:hypothetical protein
VVDGDRLAPLAIAKVATRLVASNETVPLGLVQGAAQLTVKLALPVMAAMGSLKAALIRALLRATPVALATGVTAVTVGATGGITGVAPSPVVKRQTAGLPAPGRWPGWWRR